MQPRADGGRVKRRQQPKQHGAISGANEVDPPALVRSALLSRFWTFPSSSVVRTIRQIQLARRDHNNISPAWCASLGAK